MPDQKLQSAPPPTSTPPMPAPAGTPEVSLVIDGHPVTVPRGTNLLEAARTVGIDVSYFCYHPGLSSPAVCRQCLVEVKGQPKLVPSCYTPVADKMEVFTATEKVLAVRRQMLEFTLVNHPIDCPICDKAGECTLQKLYMEWDGGGSRTDTGKVHKPKIVDVGPHIVLDAERCILCTRCIRVCDEVAGQHQLEMTVRGDRTVLSTAPGQQLDNPYSLNTVDVCPVGALTSKDFRFTMRAWELMMTPSVCPGCSTGCNVEVHHAQGQAWRLVPRFNPDVNRYWMCDEGRFTYKALIEDRVVGARMGGDPAPLDKAVAYAAERLIKAREEKKTIGVVFGAQATNEDLYLLGRVAFDVLGGKDGAQGIKLRAFVAGREPVPARADKILRSADVNPNATGARLILAAAGRKAEDVAALETALGRGELAALWIVGEDLPIGPAALAKLEGIDAIVQAVHESEVTEHARVVLPAAAWAEIDGTFTNDKGHVQRIRKAIEAPGGAQPHWQLVAAIGRKLEAHVDLPDIGAVELPAPSAKPIVVFNEMKARVPEMASALWGKALPLVQLRFAGSRG